MVYLFFFSFLSGTLTKNLLTVKKLMQIACHCLLMKNILAFVKTIKGETNARNILMGKSQIQLNGK